MCFKTSSAVFTVSEVNRCVQKLFYDEHLNYWKTSSMGLINDPPNMSKVPDPLLIRRWVRLDDEWFCRTSARLLTVRPFISKPNKNVNPNNVNKRGPAQHTNASSNVVSKGSSEHGIKKQWSDPQVILWEASWLALKGRKLSLALHPCTFSGGRSGQPLSSALALLALLCWYKVSAAKRSQ